jgi:hypothetical protein
VEGIMIRIKKLKQKSKVLWSRNRRKGRKATVEIVVVSLKQRNRVVEKYVKNAIRPKQYYSIRVSQYASNAYFVIWSTKPVFFLKTPLK